VVGYRPAFIRGSIVGVGVQNGIYLCSWNLVAGIKSNQFQNQLSTHFTKKFNKNEVVLTPY
jgi:hypothetical protein